MVTQQFHETLEPLSEWLGATEKHLINSDPIGTETSKLQDQISQHKVGSLVFYQGLFCLFFFSLVCIFSHHISVYSLLCCVFAGFFFCFFCHIPFGLLPISVVRP